MKSLFALLLMLALAAPACAAPGAHGPNGEHLDGQGAPNAAADTTPRVETFSELFELVGTLSSAGLSVLIDRYDSNEPVTDGRLDVEFKGIKATARRQADTGGYTIDDPMLIKALSAPGQHSLMFVFVAGEDSDLLEGTLVVNAAPTTDHGHGMRGWLLGGAAIAALLSVAAFHLVRRRKLGQGDWHD